MDDLLNYAPCFPLLRAFQTDTENMTYLANEVNQVTQLCRNSTLLGTFMEFHDNPRVPSMTFDIALAKNAIIYVLLADDLPLIYYGQEQLLNGGYHPYVREALWLTKYNTNAELYKSIASVNKFRNYIVRPDAGFLTYKMSAVYTDSHTIAMRKRNIISIYTNQGSSGASYNVVIPNTGYGSNVELTDVLSCKKTRTSYGGGFTATLSQGQPAIYYPTAKLGGSICASNHGGYYRKLIR